MGNRKARWFKLFGGILVSAFLLAILIARCSLPTPLYRHPVSSDE
jgi:hypothetical protein